MPARCDAFPLRAVCAVFSCVHGVSEVYWTFKVRATDDGQQSLAEGKGRVQPSKSGSSENQGPASFRLGLALASAGALPERGPDAAGCWPGCKHHMPFPLLSRLFLRTRHDFRGDSQLLQTDVPHPTMAAPRGSIA